MDKSKLAYYHYYIPFIDIYLTVVGTDHYLTKILWGSIELIDNSYQELPLFNQFYRQLIQYFEGQRQEFSIPYQLNGTDFQIKVWNCLTEIKYQQIVSYHDIALKIGNPQGAIAVGQAIAKNPLVILIGCHRVNRHNGQLGGYSGGLRIKQYLQALENKNHKLSS